MDGDENNLPGRVIVIRLSDQGSDYLERVRVHQVANGLDDTNEGVLVAGLVAVDNLVRRAFHEDEGCPVAQRVLRQIGIVQSGRRGAD